MCEGPKLRIVRSDPKYRAYTKRQFLEYYGLEYGLVMWYDAVPCNHVLVRIGREERWGLVDRISEESGILNGLMSCDDGVPVLDLVEFCGCDLDADISRHILEYLCSCQSDWWQRSPGIGALDTADQLGLSRLLQFIVNPILRDCWLRTKGRSEGLDTTPRAVDTIRVATWGSLT